MQQSLGFTGHAGSVPLACKTWGEEPSSPHSPYGNLHELPDASNSILFKVEAAKICLTQSRGNIP